MRIRFLRNENNRQCQCHWQTVAQLTSDSSVIQRINKALSNVFAEKSQRKSLIPSHAPRPHNTRFDTTLWKPSPSSVKTVVNFPRTTDSTHKQPGLGWRQIGRATVQCGCRFISRPSRGWSETGKRRRSWHLEELSSSGTSAWLHSASSLPPKSSPGSSMPCRGRDTTTASALPREWSH